MHASTDEELLLDHHYDLHRWREVLRIGERLLRRQPKNHFVLTRLASAQFELGRTDQAAPLLARAAKLAPRCPLVLWDLGGFLSSGLGQPKRSLKVYQRLIGLGLRGIEGGPCGQGRDAKAYLCDAHFKAGACALKGGAPAEARRHLKAFIRLKQGGAKSFYKVAEARRQLARIDAAQRGAAARVKG